MTENVSDQELVETVKVLNEALGRDKYLKMITKKMSNSAHKGVRTRRKNEHIATLVDLNNSLAKNDKLAFLPYHYRDPNRKISVTEYMTLLRQFPDNSQVIDELYKERLRL